MSLSGTKSFNKTLIFPFEGNKKLNSRSGHTGSNVNISYHLQFLYFLKWTIPGLFFFIFVVSIQLTVNAQCKFLPMTGFELWTSGIGSYRSTNCATTPTTALFLCFFSLRQNSTEHRRAPQRVPSRTAQRRGNWRGQGRRAEGKGRQAELDRRSSHELSTQHMGPNTITKHFCNNSNTK